MTSKKILIPIRNVCLKVPKGKNRDKQELENLKSLSLRSKRISTQTELIRLLYVAIKDALRALKRSAI